MSERERGPLRNSGVSHLPAVWLAFVILWSIYALGKSWPLFGADGLPTQVTVFVYGGLCLSIVVVLWGLYVLSLALAGSSRFPRRFIVWQGFVIAGILAREAYVLAVPDFVFSSSSLAISAAQIAIGLLCIHLLRRGAGTEPADGGQNGGRRPLAATLIMALLGVIFGAAIGCAIGLGIGILLQEALHISCFEGGCGYFVVLIALIGLLVGAAAGPALALWLARRRTAG